jgi:hypothetical protein
LVRVAWQVIDHGGPGLCTKLIVHAPEGRVNHNGNNGRYPTLVDWPADLRDTQIIIGAIWPTGFFQIEDGGKVVVQNYRDHHRSYALVLEGTRKRRSTDVRMVTSPTTLIWSTSANPKAMVGDILTRLEPRR